MNVLISFPYLGMDDAGETTREWAHMRFKSDIAIPMRRVKREVRKWVKRNLGRTLHTRELLMIMKRAHREDTGTVYSGIHLQSESDTVH